jgi:hypothetical protein
MKKDRKLRGLLLKAIAARSREIEALRGSENPVIREQVTKAQAAKLAYDTVLQAISGDDVLLRIAGE